MSNGWDESATAWIDGIGDRGDYSREYVLDAPMLERVRIGQHARALDVGCGEGRFCRMLSRLGISAVGIDPTRAFIDHAKNADPTGDYRVGQAEQLEFPDAAFDLVVSYLTLIDIPDIERAITEMARVLRPQGTLLIANLNSFSTAGQWTDAPEPQRRFQMDRYLEERAEWQSWRGINIKNWHRPLSTYMGLLLAQGLQLRYFAEPAARDGNPAQAEHYNRVPYFLIMEWQKPDDAQPMPEMKIEPLSAQSLSRIVGTDRGNGWKYDVASWDKAAQDHARGNRLVLVAMEGDRPLGYGSLLWQSSYPAFATDRVPEIHDLVVAADSRGQGVGTKLISELERYAAEAGHKAIGLGVGLYADYGAAQRLYTSLGYRPDGRGVTYQDRPIRPGAMVRMDDDLVLWMIKGLATVPTLPPSDLDRANG